MRTLATAAMLAACHATPAAGPTAPAPPAGPSLATALAGPFADVAAYCATTKQPDSGLPCGVFEGLARDGAPPATWRGLEVLHVPGDTAPLSSCALAVRGERGWFVTPASEDACHEPSFISASNAKITSEGKVTIVEVGVHWQAKASVGGEADYTLAFLCGMRADAPACARAFVSRCTPGAPVGECDETHDFEASWQVDGDRVTIEAAQHPPSARAPFGTHALL